MPIRTDAEVETISTEPEPRLEEVHIETEEEKLERAKKKHEEFIFQMPFEQLP